MTAPTRTDLTAALAALTRRRTVRISTVRGTGLHYVALMEGDRVLVPIGPHALPENVTEQVAAEFAALYGVDVSRLDVDVYDRAGS